MLSIIKRVIVSFLFCLLFYSSSAQITFGWAKSIGGPSGDEGYRTVSDAAGNVYVMGSFWGTVDMDPGPGIFNLTSAGQSDNFISKFDAAGNFIWAKQFGNNFNDQCTALSIDNNNNLLLTGNFYSTVDFDPGPGVFNMTCHTTGYAAFLLKLDSDGNFIWAKEIAETDYGSSGTAISSTASGNIYLSGRFTSTADFDPGPGVYTMTSASTADDIFILKLDAGGNFIWAKQFTGPNGKTCYSTAVDAQENIYFTGTFYGTCDFDPSTAVYNLTANNNNGSNSSDTYIVKLNMNGNFVFAKQVNADYNDIGWGITLDQTGNILIAGEFTGNADFDPGAGTYMLNSGLYSDGYILKLDNAGNFIWAKQIESVSAGNANSRGFSIATDNFGNVYTCGDFTGSIDLDPSPASFIISTTSLEDTYIIKLDPTGNFIFGGQLKGSFFTQPGYMYVDQQKNITITGRYSGTADFDPTTGIYNLTSVAGSGDIFVLKLTQACALSTTSTINASACNSYTLNNQTYTTSGTYTQTLINAAGCDSVITLHLQLGGSTTTIVATACNAYFWEGQTYTTSGAYSVKYTDAEGCDSTRKLNLTINKSVATNIAVSICQGQTYAGHTTTGTYTDLFTAANGCDSVRTVVLTVKSKSTANITASICEGQTYEGYATSGTYTNTFVAANGCDSIRTLYLTVNPKKITNVNASICAGQSYIAGGGAQTIAGIYKDTLQTYLHCDSIIITNLVVYQKPVPNLGADKAICSATSTVLYPGAYNNYLWQDFSTQPNFTASQPGLYWVTVTDNNHCTATDSLRITALLPSPLNFLKPTDSVCFYEKLLLQPTKTYPNYLWSTGSAESTIIVQTPANYWLQVTDINGCKGYDTITVLSKPCKTGVFIPNSFTPNNDGKNDLFRATVRGNVIYFKLEVYNRYGQLVFQTTDPNKGWNGTYKESLLPTTALVCQCSYQIEGNAPGYQKGSVLLIR